MMNFESLEYFTFLRESLALESKLANSRDGKGTFLTMPTYERQACCATDTLPRASDAES